MPLVYFLVITLSKLVGQWPLVSHAVIGLSQWHMISTMLSWVVNALQQATMLLISLWSTFPPFILYPVVFFFFYFLFYLFFLFFFISWRLITLQYCSGLCHTLKWISHGFTCVPHLDPHSHLPLHPIPLGLPIAPALSTCLMHPTWAGDLFHPR